MALERCMKYKCKVCPKKLECDEKLKQERLTYRPFENLKELLEKKGSDLIGHCSR